MSSEFDLKLERECITRQSERRQIEADEFYYRMALTHPEGSEERELGIKKSNWAFERQNGLTTLSFKEWQASNRKGRKKRK